MKKEPFISFHPIAFLISTIGLLGIGFTIGVACNNKKEEVKTSKPVYIDWGNMNYIVKLSDSTVGRFKIKSGYYVGFDTLTNIMILDTTDVYIPGAGYYTHRKYISIDSEYNHTKSDESRPIKSGKLPHNWYDWQGSGSDLPAKIEGKKRIQAKIKKPKRLYIGDSGDDGGGGRMVWGGDTTYSTPDSTSIKLIHYNKTEYAPRYDTIRVMMLVTDTSGPLYVDDIRKAGNRLEGGFTQWKMGYSVRKNVGGGVLSYNAEKNAWIEKPYFIHDHYLDVDKKIMKKDIVVWDSKRLN